MKNFFLLCIISICFGCTNANEEIIENNIGEYIFNNISKNNNFFISDVEKVCEIETYKDYCDKVKLNKQWCAKSIDLELETISELQELNQYDYSGYCFQYIKSCEWELELLTSILASYDLNLINEQNFIKAYVYKCRFVYLNYDLTINFILDSEYRVNMISTFYHNNI